MNESLHFDMIIWFLVWSTFNLNSRGVHIVCLNNKNGGLEVKGSSVGINRLSPCYMQKLWLDIISNLLKNFYLATNFVSDFIILLLIPLISCLVNFSYLI